MLFCGTLSFFPFFVFFWRNARGEKTERLAGCLRDACGMLAGSPRNDFKKPAERACGTPAGKKTMIWEMGLCGPCKLR